jgi:signal peptide peptidase SppA
MRAKADFYATTFTNAIKAYSNKSIIPLIKIKGHITPLQTHSVTKSLNLIPTKNVKFLAVVINSAGGSPGQCHIISKKLEAYSKNTGIPIYTFAEDLATSGGYFLLSCGEKVFADNASMVGGVGAVHRHLNFKKALENYDVYIQKYATSDKPLSQRLSWSEELNEESRTLVREVLRDTHERFIQHVEEKRGSKIVGDEATKKEELYDGSIFLGKKAQEKGLVDEVVNFREYVYEKHPESKIVDVSRPSLADRVRFVVSKFVAVSSDMAVLRYLTKNNLNQ